MAFEGPCRTPETPGRYELQLAICEPPEGQDANPYKPATLGKPIPIWRCIVEVVPK